MGSATLTAVLECDLPNELSVGRGTALFVCGWCFCPEAQIRSLNFVVAGDEQRVAHHGMPRLDPFRALHPALDATATGGISADPGSPEDPLLHSYRSGFWGLVRIPDHSASGELELLLQAELEDGSDAMAELARITVLPRPEPVALRWPEPTGGPTVAICMATYNPPADLLRRQLESIRAQTHRNWMCFISDDCSSPNGYAVIEAAIEGDPRFIVSRSSKRLGFYRNFERALNMVPPSARYVAMADQDDVWREDKIEALLQSIGEAQLIYSDARIVSRTGEVIAETWWGRRRNNYSNLFSLLIANSVTGAASLFRRDLLEYALPFPPAQFAHFHDHWIGLVALSLGDIAFVDRPLYDYVQHGHASLGHAAANQTTSLRDRLLRQRGLHERVRTWRVNYFVDVCRLLQFATILEMRCLREMSSSRRRALESFLETDRSLVSFALLALRGARERIGMPQTLGAEWLLLRALAWRRGVSATARDRPQSRLRLDALPPESLVQRPGLTGLHESAKTVAEKIAPLQWAPSDEAPERINLLIPTIDLEHFFGGYITKLNLARRLGERGRRVRIVTVDPVGRLPSDWKRALESYSGLEGLFSKVEVVFGRESSEIEVSPSDSFIATTWWTAHIAHHVLEAVRSDRFTYLIQEYEPFTFPMGTYAALANESYQFRHFALFSSELLRDYFRQHGIGVYAAGTAAGERASAAFQNAITPVDRPTVDQLASRQTKRLLFYARPERHGARNMFELGLLALARALEDGTFQSGWELHGVGAVQRGDRISLGGGTFLDLLPRADQSSYGALLREHDVGLALMYTPHPSLVPIEMASAGMLTVTNSFENKTPERMTEISANLITVEPSIEQIADALAQAAAGASDLDRRIRGSEVRWSTSWAESFHDDLLDRVLSVLEQADVAVA